MDTSSTPLEPSSSTAPPDSRSTLTAAELNEPLKRCAGCSLSTYCSKECQGASWVLHKFGCRSKNVKFGHERTARATLPGQGNALWDWVQAHKYALEHMARAALFLTGTGATAAMAADRAVIFPIALGTSGSSSSYGSGFSSRPGDNDPATTFRILSKPEFSPESLVRTDPRHLGKLVKEQKAQCRERSEAECTPAPGKMFCPTFVGYVPVIFLVAASGVTLAHCYNIYHMLGECDNPLAPHARALHEDVMDVCFKAVNRGYVLKSPDRWARPQAPLMCRFKKSQKEKIWKLRPVQWDWDRDVSEVISADATARRLKVQPPTTMWGEYNELW
ncbi:hypothetical protein OH76DRAFT_1485369 [Lentinus brumalis]|uniref:MYND-type domain-containing protein n=1 Tax=Lentinus brumalis TaxID=2498619 RepID=A0A371D2D5_9APHY|nr:hypothetical protein OH76DRAFT_1485369 [Polyporus brumalis]